MKSLAELQAIKDKMKDKVVLREGTGEIRVVVGFTDRLHRHLPV